MKPHIFLTNQGWVVSSGKPMKFDNSGARIFQPITETKPTMRAAFEAARMHTERKTTVGGWIGSMLGIG